jgi:hypothetical protein
VPPEVSAKVNYFGFTFEVFEAEGVPVITLTPGANRYRSRMGPS